MWYVSSPQDCRLHSLLLVPSMNTYASNITDQKRTQIVHRVNQMKSSTGHLAEDNSLQDLATPVGSLLQGGGGGR